MASEKILESKKAKVAALTEMLQDSVSFVLVDYKGISVEDDTKLRKELREAGVHYVVEKNSMLRFAFKNMGIDAFDEVLHGTTAVALSKDDQTARTGQVRCRSRRLLQSEGWLRRRRCL